MKEIVDRISEIYGSSDDFEIKYEEVIPLNELFTAIDEHFQVR